MPFKVERDLERGCIELLSTAANNIEIPKHSNIFIGEISIIIAREGSNRKVLNNLICFFLISTFLFFSGFTASAEEFPLSLGRHLAKQGNYDAAITEYKRFLFFHPEDPRAGEIYHAIGLAYRAQNIWTEAIDALRIATHYATDSVTKSEYQLALAVTLIATKNYDLAQLELIKVTLRNPPAQLYRRTLFLQAVAYIYQFRWEEARRVLRDYITDDSLDARFDAALNMPRKSIKIARLLSKILPGAGHVYTGDWRGGLNALLLNGALGFLTIDAVLDEHYTDAVLWAGVVFLRYYRGNTFRAETAVKQFNLRQFQRAAEVLLQRLQEIVGTP